MSSVPARLRIDFVSDVACPWCAVGLASLQQALAALDGSVEAEIHLQPFELDPHLPLEGEDADQRLMQKYGIGEAQLEANRKAIRDRAAPLGVAINTHRGSRAWNTFDAHRLLHWAATQDRDRAIVLKQALFRAYFTDEKTLPTVRSWFASRRRSASTARRRAACWRKAHTPRRSARRSSATSRPASAPSPPRSSAGNG